MRINIDEKTLFVQRFRGENYIHVEVTTRTPLRVNANAAAPYCLSIGDYIRYNGINYYINTAPEVTKEATNYYHYVIKFESEYYSFSKVQYRSAGLSDFYLMGDAELFVDLLVTNMNRVSSGWTKGTVTPTNAEYKLLHFDAENCRAAIQRICEEFNGEFSFDRKVISFSDEKTTDTGLTFAYKAGLRNIKREPIDSGNIITRLYALGSTKNLGSAYGKLRLELNTGGVDYVDSNTATYGIIEGTVIFEDVFPRRTGTVSSVASNVKFTDSAIDFNVNDYLIPGVTAKVNFLTGDCAGYTFDIYSFDNGTKEFEIIPVTLEDGTELPNVTLNPAGTDKYVIIDITMPNSYVTAAEDELLALANTYLSKYDHPRVTYQLEPDWRYMKDNAVNLTIGDTITIEDADLDVDVKVRITGLSQQIINPYKYKLSLTDQVEYIYSNAMEQVVISAYKTSQTTAAKVATSPANDTWKSRRNWRTNEELRNIIIAPDGYINIGLLTANNIQTGRLESEDGGTYFDLDNNTLVIASGDGTIAGVNITSIEDGADVTGNHTAANISGQGNLATQDTADWASDVANIPARLNEDDTPAATGVYITPNYIGFWDKDNTNWPVRIKNNAGAGEFYVGDGASEYVSYASGVLTVRGTLNADDITAGTLTGRTVQTDTAGQRIVLSRVTNNLIFHTDTESDVITIDDNIAGSSKPGIRINANTGGYITCNDKDNAGSHYSEMWDGLMTVHRNAAGGCFRGYRYVTSSTTGIFMAVHAAATTGLLFHGVLGNDDVFTVDTTGRIVSASTITATTGFKIGAVGVVDGSRNLVNIGAMTLTGSISMSAGQTVDGVDISAHASNVNAHHAQIHDNTYHSTNYATETHNHDTVYAPISHKASHQNGGSDEINVAGLSGVLADAQTPAAHNHDSDYAPLSHVGDTGSDQHGLVSAVAAGFMSVAQRAKLNDALVATGGQSGTYDTTANWNLTFTDGKLTGATPS